MTQAATLAPAATKPDIHDIYERYVAAFSTKDISQITPLHAENGTFWLHTGRDAVQGRAAIGAMFQGFFDQWPEFGFEVYRTLFTETNWILDWAVTAVLKNADGSPRPIKFHALDVIDIDDDGLVLRKDTFVDSAQVAAALKG